MKTNKFNNMISSFQCDFIIARSGKVFLSELDDKIKKNDERILRDIELLSELEFLIRTGQAEIHLK